jgi:phosphatidylglycerophosphatase A
MKVEYNMVFKLAVCDTVFVYVELFKPQLICKLNQNSKGTIKIFEGTD